MKPRSPVLLLVVVLASALLVAGCGSKKKTSASSPPSSQTTTAASTSKTTTKSSSGSSSGSIGNCPELAKVGAKFQAALAAANASAKGDPAKQAENTAKLFDAFAKQAPSEIRGDFEVFAQALSGYATALAKAHYTPGSGKAPTAAQLALITQAAKSFSGPKMAQATAHIQTWAKTHCPGSNFGG